MAEFYVGCRISEIEMIGPAPEKSDPKFPCRIIFKSGRSITVSTEWRDAVREVEAILSASRNSAAQEVERNQFRLETLKRQIGEAEAELEDLQSQKYELMSTDAPVAQQAGLMWKAYRKGSRPYLVGAEKEILDALFQAMEAPRG